MPKTQYPLPGTNAERVLAHLVANPGSSTNSIISALGMNPTVARKCITSLLQHSRIKDTAESENQHEWTPIGKSL